jgi:hypothetical protein
MAAAETHDLGGTPLGILAGSIMSTDWRDRKMGPYERKLWEIRYMWIMLLVKGAIIAAIILIKSLFHGT